MWSQLSSRQLSLLQQYKGSFSRITNNPFTNTFQTCNMISKPDTHPQLYLTNLTASSSLLLIQQRFHRHPRRKREERSSQNQPNNNNNSDAASFVAQELEASATQSSSKSSNQKQFKFNNTLQISKVLYQLRYLRFYRMVYYGSRILLLLVAAGWFYLHIYPDIDRRYLKKPSEQSTDTESDQQLNKVTTSSALSSSSPDVTNSNIKPPPPSTPSMLPMAILTSFFVALFLTGHKLSNHIAYKIVLLPNRRLRIYSFAQYQRNSALEHPINNHVTGPIIHKEYSEFDTDTLLPSFALNGATSTQATLRFVMPSSSSSSSSKPKREWFICDVLDNQIVDNRQQILLHILKQNKSDTVQSYSS